MAALVAAVVAVGQDFLTTNQPVATKVDAAFTWAETQFDFGAIKKDVPVTHEFSFTNSGNDVLIISSVQASCGCTVTDYTKTPLPPGEKGFVKATYNAAKAGVFSKTLTINANTGTPVVLTIKGEVVE